MNKKELLRRIGSIDTYCRAEEFTFDAGKARGSRGIRVKCGDLSLTILPDRCMDIAYAEFCGTPVSYDSCTGVVSPAHYNEQDFLRSFTAGLLTTCGLTQTGGGCEDDGEVLGLHGRIGNAPACDVSITRGWEGEEYILKISGTMKQAKVFGENLELKRTYEFKLFENSFTIYDTVTNLAYSPSPFMLLYHINFGYPLIDETTVLTTNTDGPNPQTDIAAAGIHDAKTFSAPVKDYQEQVFYYHSKEAPYARLTNEKLGMFAEVRYSAETLPYLVEWKQLGEGLYVVGLEPGTNPPSGRKTEREKGRLTYIQPGEEKKFSVKVSFGK